MFFDATGKHDGGVVDRGRAALRLLRADRGERRQEEGRRRRWSIFHWGTITSFPAFITSVSAKYTLFALGRHPDPGHLHGRDGGDAGRARRAEPDLGQRCRAHGCTR